MASYRVFLRKTHRYLGLFIGVQFLFWTLGGLYFSWTNIKQIRGEDLRKMHEHLPIKSALVSPQSAIEAVREREPEAGIMRLQTVSILGEPFYEVRYMAGEKEASFLASAVDGGPRGPISAEEAMQIAKESLLDPAEVKAMRLLTEENVGGHHEYREKPLPAWAVTFESGVTVYVAAETGQVGAVRTNGWRVFDFLWMLHTMGFGDRDNINNYLLRAFSIFGLATILSGFALFFVSSKFFRRISR